VNGHSMHICARSSLLPTIGFGFQMNRKSIAAFRLSNDFHRISDENDDDILYCINASKSETVQRQINRAPFDFRGFREPRIVIALSL
jgi:hypothetical protein